MQSILTDSTDSIIPQGKWSFDKDVTAVFDNMLARSIPQYKEMRQACFEIACRYRQEGSWIIDLGCSRGEAIAGLIDKFGAHNKYCGIDISDPMLDVTRKRFDGYIQSGIVEVSKVDLRHSYPIKSASVILCVLTLQFTPIEYRHKILANIYNSLRSGGALILVEKVIGSSSEIDEAMVDTYINLKSKHGYTQEQIERKKLSLEGVLVPVTAKWNEELLSIAGFRHVDCFWRWMNFAGWMAIR
ncbi:MAG: methyltransferase domain-containing protein [Colwellia sp.]|nr:methyltransferase domain-containing protein [Colwellia sp.]